MEEIIKFTRYFGYLYFLAANENIHYREINKEINKLGLTELYLSLCELDNEQVTWTNEGILYNNVAGEIIKIKDKSDFIKVLQSKNKNTPHQ